MYWYLLYSSTIPIEGNKNEICYTKNIFDTFNTQNYVIQILEIILTKSGMIFSSFLVLLYLVLVCFKTELWINSSGPSISQKPKMKAASKIRKKISIQLLGQNILLVLFSKRFIKNLRETNFYFWWFHIVWQCIFIFKFTLHSLCHF